MRLFVYCQSLLQQRGEKFILTLNEREKVLPAVFWSFSFISLLRAFYFLFAFFGGFVLNAKT